MCVTVFLLFFVCFALFWFPQSPNGLYVLQFLSDGNLGLFAGGVELWQAPRTANRGIPGRVSFDPRTGIVSMHSAQGEQWWASNEIWAPAGTFYNGQLDQQGCWCRPDNCMSARGWFVCLRYYGGGIPWCASTIVTAASTPSLHNRVCVHIEEGICFLIFSVVWF